MLDLILRTAKQSSYDFRSTAFPSDPLAHYFEQWVPYYRLKWAIAKVVNPSSILEIGVRYGYSAAAFLNGCPAAHYLGIDLNSDTFGGVQGALDWAKQITANFRAQFVIANSQHMETLPGQIYDLIHVDGQQDGDGTFHDMQLASRQGRFVLADGFFWSRQNFAALSEFVYQFREMIEFCGIIPGYAGELLIKMQEPALQETPSARQLPSSQELREQYTSSYYLHDCGGYVQYRETKGKVLEDQRLKDVAALAGLKNGGRVLDLGCGRGELARYFAGMGFAVTAIDYSPDAIALAEQCFVDEPELREKVRLICGDVCSVDFGGRYELITASDIIEHLSPSELEGLYERVAQHLASGGLFIVHTFPNLWYYKYEYARKRRLAASVGAYLSPQPRSRYEQIMHINEQCPRRLLRSLKRHFDDVVLWFAEPDNPGGSLARRFSKGELRAAPDLFAVAGQHKIDRAEVLAQIVTPPTALIRPGELELSVQQPAGVSRGCEFSILVTVQNGGEFLLNSFPPNPFRFSYHWFNSSGDQIIDYEGLRTPVWPSLSPGETRTYNARVQAPVTAGLYLLRVTLVQELVRWLDQEPVEAFADLSISVKGGIPHL